jgi:hypothetical protein
MPAIILNKFSGMLPKIDGRMLPPEAAQQAHNVNLAGGKLSPINVPGPFKVLHDPDTGAMKSGIPLGNIISIDEPDPPTITERIKLFRPAQPGPPANDGFSWEFTLGLWVGYYDENNAWQIQIEHPSFVADAGSWEYTEDGAIYRTRITSSVLVAKQGFYYKSYGIKWQCSFVADTKYFGGPESTHTFPETALTWSSPEWTDFSMPLTAPIDYTGYANDGNEVYTGERYTYGHLQLVSVNAPRPLPDVDRTIDHNGQPLAYDGTSINIDLIDAGSVEFHFKTNYQRNRQVFVNYASSAVDQRVSEGASNIAHSGAITRIDMKDIDYGSGDVPATGYVRLVNAAGQFEDVQYSSYGIISDIYQFTVSTTLTYSYAEDDTIIVIDRTTVGKEGPASELSELTTVDPGDILLITSTRGAAYNRQKLYKSSSDATARILNDELELDTYIDTFIENPGEALPPNGNYPHSTLAEAMEGSVVLGGHIAMIFDDDEVRPSEPYKQWVYPEEYAFPLDGPFIAAASFGSSAIVFTDTHPITGEVGKVFAFSGQNPRYLNRLLISNDKPLLNKRSLCMIDNTAFYATTDGLMAVSPGGIQNITEGLFTRSEWLDLNPSLMSAWTADNSIFVIGLSTTNPVHFRFDIGEGGLATFSTYDSFSDADMYWKSKIWPSPRPVSFRDMQVIADDFPVEITLIGDGGVAKKTILVPSEKSKKLPRLHPCRDWEVEIRGRTTVSQVSVATSIRELNA